MRPIFSLILLSVIVWGAPLSATERDGYFLNIDKLDQGKPAAAKQSTSSTLDNFDLHTDYTAALADNSAASEKTKASTDALAAPEKSKSERVESPCGRFAKGTRRINTFGGITEAVDGKQSIYFGGVAGEYFIVDDLSLRAELVAYSVDQHEWEDSLGAGFNALARWYALKSKDQRLSFFIEGGGGVAEFDGRTPGRKGTDFEFTVHAGFGGDFKLTNSISLFVAPRWLHISNAGIHGKSRHGGLDSVGGYLGIGVKF
jgi:hypothetical protein